MTDPVQLDLPLDEWSDFDGGSHADDGDMRGDRGGSIDVTGLDDVVAAEWLACGTGPGAVYDLVFVDADGDGCGRGLELVAVPDLGASEECLELVDYSLALGLG